MDRFDVLWRNAGGNPGATFMLREGSDDAIVVGEVWGEDVYRLDWQDLAGATVVDVGANCGAFTVAALALGATTVVAIEPDAGNVDALALNVAAWQDTHPDAGATVHVVRAAAGGEAAIGQVHTSPGGAGTYVEVGSVLGHQVPVRTLAELVDSFDVGSIDLLKLDTEGAEYSILPAADEVLARTRRIVMEFHHAAHATNPGQAIADPRWAGMVAQLAERFSLEVVGRPSAGGMLFGWNYS